MAQLIAALPHAIAAGPLKSVANRPAPETVPAQMKSLLFALLFLVAFGCAVNQTKPHDARVRIGDATIRVDFGPRVTAPRAELLEWVRRAGVAVTNCLGVFPANGVVIRIHGGGNKPIANGVTHGASSIDVRVGTRSP